jgi:CheY-like chemotaxis protein
LVLIDRGQLEQVILNLIVNAHDAMPGPVEAIALVRNEGWHFQLLVSDVSMPGISGFALVRQLREEVDTPIRTLFITGYTPEDERRNDNKSDDPVLQKPFDREELLHCIRGILQKELSS